MFSPIMKIKLALDTISSLKTIPAYCKDMIQKTQTSGYMARHIISWARPDYPTFDEFYQRSQVVDDGANDAFLERMLKFWVKLGKDRSDPLQITTYSRLMLIDIDMNVGHIDAKIDLNNRIDNQDSNDKVVLLVDDCSCC